MKKTKQERLQIVIDLCKRLKSFPTAPHPLLETELSHLNLYDSDFDAILQIKKIFNMYVNQDDTNPDTLIGFSGKIKFPELNKIIEYILPIKQKTNPLFVFRST